MAVAMIHPEPGKAYRGKKADSTAKLLENKNFSGPALSMARTVLAVLPELAAQVPFAERASLIMQSAILRALFKNVAIAAPSAPIGQDVAAFHGPIMPKANLCFHR
jgi:hypothetical protein